MRPDSSLHDLNDLYDLFQFNTQHKLGTEIQKNTKNIFTLPQNFFYRAFHHNRLTLIVVISRWLDLSVTEHLQQRSKKKRHNYLINLFI